MKSKFWCYTLNNFTEKEVNKLKKYKCIYHIMGEEVAPSTGTPHIQGYFEFEIEKEKKNLIKAFPRASFRYAVGSGEDNQIYCSKEKKLFELGTPTKTGRGHRSDLDQLRDDILEGKKTVDEITLASPLMFHQYGRTISKIEDLRMRKIFRNFMTEGIWLYGETGSGKSYEAFKDFHPDTHYCWKNEHWQDGYTQQETVIIDDFRGNLPFNELLKMVDCHPNYYCYRRGREPMPFTSKKVIITSPLKPEEVYSNLHFNDNFQQFSRRFTVKEIKKNTGSG